MILFEILWGKNKLSCNDRIAFWVIFSRSLKKLYSDPLQMKNVLLGVPAITAKTVASRPRALCNFD